MQDVRESLQRRVPPRSAAQRAGNEQVTNPLSKKATAARDMAELMREAAALLREWREAASHLSKTGELATEDLRALRMAKAATDGFFNRHLDLAVDVPKPGL
jgi:hypothetical protein